jgi:hypothetical protein
MHQLMQNLIFTVHSYAIALINPVDHASPEIGPVLAGLPVQTFYLVIARHGTARCLPRSGAVDEICYTFSSCW